MTTSIGSVIQPGQPIPDDVTGVRDPTLDTWCQQDDGLWDAFVGDTDEPVGGSYEDCSAAALRALYPTLTVTAVREQPAESVSGLCEVGTDKVTCIVMDADHRRIYHSGRPVPSYASTEALLHGAEPVRKLIGPPHAHLDAPCTDACYEPAESRFELLTLPPGRGLVLAACGHWWRETRPPDTKVRSGQPRVCAACPPGVPNAPGRSEQGLALVQVEYVEETAPEPQQADASLLLDLVQQLRVMVDEDTPPYDAHALLDRIAALVQREEADALQTITDRDLYHEWADKLATAIAERTGADIGEHSSANNPWRVAYESLAALVPQQPVQARDETGALLWINKEGCVSPGADDGDNAAWLPLLVGGDPAPENGILAHARKALHERDAARAEVERLAVELAVEREAEERGNAELKDIVRRLDEAEVDSGGASERVGYAIQSMQRGWATATNNLALLDTVKSDRETIRGSLNHLKDTVTGPAIELLGVQHNEDIVPAIERLKAAQPDPRKLSLPKVPEGTEALVGLRTGTKYWPDGDTYGVEVNGLIHTDEPFSLADVLDREDPDGVRVELAPPREPRTWPKLDDEPDVLPQLVQVADHGQWTLKNGRLYVSVGNLYDEAHNLAQLRMLGDVTEVTE